jgi:hypothetical protein
VVIGGEKASCRLERVTLERGMVVVRPEPSARELEAILAAIGRLRDDDGSPPPAWWTAGLRESLADEEA